MKRHDRLATAGWIGLIAGLALVGLGLNDATFAPLARGYGTLLAASAVWLLGGLALQSLIVHKRLEARPAIRRRHSATGLVSPRAR